MKPLLPIKANQVDVQSNDDLLDLILEQREAINELIEGFNDSPKGHCGRCRGSGTVMTAQGWSLICVECDGTGRYVLPEHRKIEKQTNGS